METAPELQSVSVSGVKRSREGAEAGWKGWHVDFRVGCVLAWPGETS